MRTCEETLDLIFLRLDGELTPEQALELEEHLASCPACRAIADDLAGIHSVMPGMNVEPPASIMENVMERIKGEAAKVVPFPAKKHSAHRWKAWGGVAAALVLVAGGAFVLWGGNDTTGGAPMTLDAGIVEPSTAPSPYKAAIEEAEGEAVIALPTPEPSAVPSSAPAEAGEPAAEPVPQVKDKIAVDSGEGNETTAPTGGEAPQPRAFMMPPPQPSASALPSDTPSATPSPTPDNQQMMVGLQISPVTMSLTPAEAAKKLYEEKYAETHTGAVLTEQEDFIGYVAPDWSLKYVGETEDGTAYEFAELAGEGDVEAVLARYLVPLDGSEIQRLDSETVE